MEFANWLDSFYQEHSIYKSMIIVSDDQSRDEMMSILAENDHVCGFRLDKENHNRIALVTEAEVIDWQQDPTMYACIDDVNLVICIRCRVIHKKHPLLAELLACQEEPPVHVIKIDIE